MTYSPTPAEDEAFKFLFSVATENKGGSIGGSSAVQFFVKSGVPTPVLKQIWALASNGKPVMGYEEFACAMRLIALAQQGQTPDGDTLQRTRNQKLNFPTFQGVSIPQSQQSKPSSQSPPLSYTIPSDVAKQYNQLWKAQPKNGQGFIEGKDAVGFFAKSGQSREILRAVWQMADVNADGKLDEVEFFVAMHLTMLCKKGHGMPETLPSELLQSARAAVAAAGAGGGLNSSTMMNASALNTSAAFTTNRTGEKSGGSDDVDGSLNIALSGVTQASNTLQKQLSQSQTDVSRLRDDRDKLLTLLQQANARFQADAERLRELDKEIARMRDEVNVLRSQVDARQAAVSSQQDQISAKYDELNALSKMGGGANKNGGGGGAVAYDAAAAPGQKRRMQPTGSGGGGGFDDLGDFGAPPPPSTSGATKPAGGAAFDAFDNPYGT